MAGKSLPNEKGVLQVETHCEGTSPGPGIQVPDNCEIFVDGKQLCKRWQIGRCTAKIKPGKRCMVGYHMCWLRAMSAHSDSLQPQFKRISPLRIFRRKMVSPFSLLLLLKYAAGQRAPQSHFAWQVQHVEHLQRGPRKSGED